MTVTTLCVPSAQLYMVNYKKKHFHVSLLNISLSKDSSFLNMCLASIMPATLLSNFLGIDYLIVYPHPVAKVSFSSKEKSQEHSMKQLPLTNVH